MDSKHNIITDSYVTPASVHDSIPYLEQLDRQRERFGFEVEAVGLDAGYNTAAICKNIRKIALLTGGSLKNRLELLRYLLPALLWSFLIPSPLPLRAPPPLTIP